MKKTLILIACAVFLSLILWQTIKYKPAIGLNRILSSADIVFIPFDNNPIHANENGHTLGFINADGSKHAEYRFAIPGGSKDMLGFRRNTYAANSPRWSRSGDLIVFYIRDSGPNIRIMDVNGNLLGQDCYLVANGSSTFDSFGNIYGLINKDAPIYSEYQNKITTGESMVARISLRDCKINDVFTLPLPSNSFLNEINESAIGLIVASYYDVDKNIYKILIYNPLTKSDYSFPGYHPSFSDNGKLLAYFNPDGELIVQDMETNNNKKVVVVDNWKPDFLSMPGWSPDNNWLVYNTSKGEIYKVDIRTGEKIYLTSGWDPDWK